MDSANRFINTSSVIRLTCFRYKSGPPMNAEDASGFIAAWKGAAENTKPDVLYRELSQQVPEWSAEVAAEMDHPIEHAFLEYSVLSAETNPSDLSSVAAPMLEKFEVDEALYKVDFRFVKESREVGDVLMFNLFELNGPPGMVQGFLMNWPPRGEFKMKEAASLSAVLHESITAGARFSVFNRSEVVSADAYADGIARFEQAFPRAERKQPEVGTGAQKPPVASHLGLFRIVDRIAKEPGRVDHFMKAAVIREHGGPEVLVYEDVPKPHPATGQILLRVKAVSINPLDVKMRSGEVEHIYPPWFPDILGYSVAGVIEELGLGVTDRKVGEEVYGINNPIMRNGYAEFVAGPASFYYPKPASMNFATAAAAPSIFATAHGALFGRSNLQAGQRVLIHGGSGVIGSCAVQLAKQAGAYVITTASTKNVAGVKELGADEVIDYRSQRFEDLVRDVDLVVDTVGGETRERSWAVIKRGGTLASLLPPPPDPQKAQKMGIQAYMVHGHPNIGEIMPEMTRRLTTGELKAPEIAASFSLKDAAAAHAFFEKDAPRGRVVLEV